MKLDIIYEDKEIIVCYKPSGVATQTASLGSPDMVSMLKNYLTKKGEGNYLGVIHRLDQMVSGLLVFAKTKKSAAALSKQIQDGNANKDYLALCYGVPEERKGTLVHYMMKDPQTKLAKVMSEKEQNLKNNRAGKTVANKIGTDNPLTHYKKAVLNYEVEEEREDCSVLRIHLQTGRFHQIRAQFAAIGNVLLGDVKYGTVQSKEFSAKEKINTVALCAYRLVLKHPITGKDMEFVLNNKQLPNWYQKKRIEV